MKVLIDINLTPAWVDFFIACENRKRSLVSLIQHKVASFIQSLADDVLRDLDVRGNYCDVILPMTVRRRVDAVLEPSEIIGRGAV